MATIAELEQWIAEIEIALTLEHRRSGKPRTSALAHLRERLAFLHLRRRSLLAEDYRDCIEAPFVPARREKMLPGDRRRPSYAGRSPAAALSRGAGG